MTPEPIPLTVCQAVRCLAPVTPPALFCGRHWAMVLPHQRRLLADAWGWRHLPLALGGVCVYLAVAEGHLTRQQGIRELDRLHEQLSALTRVRICDEPD